MGVVRQWMCARHGIFECTHPICPAFGCDSEAVAPEWPQPHDATARGPAARIHGRGSSLRAAQSFLQRALQTGPVPAVEVLRQGVAAGHTAATVRRAKAALRIQSIKERGHFGASTQQQWRWRLP
jgi:hypothetical protein